MPPDPLNDPLSALAAMSPAQRRAVRFGIATDADDPAPESPAVSAAEAFLSAARADRPTRQPTDFNDKRRHYLNLILGRT